MPAAIPQQASPLRQHLELASLRVVALLAFAMLAPAALPAGGGDRRLPEVRRRESHREPLLSVGCESLRCAPYRDAPLLVGLEQGVPLRVLRSWRRGGSANRWLLVEALMAAGQPVRGWVSD